ncbi:MAG: penicillin-binding transpeptidase domain-containing protein, partial [Edaphobacter sp.]
PSNQLPTMLPDGAHRVITEMTSAKMRKMMQGIVVEGTGKEAALNGYSSAGKTGTAQKIDVATHTYSHTKLVASFAGFAPVSSPAISVAVVIDTPTVGASRYGGAVSAPVFAEVAQQVLEYLGVPHDQPLKTKKEMMVAQKETSEDGPSESAADLTSMFDDVNNLPADDPLRTTANDAASATAGKDERPVIAAKASGKTLGGGDLLPAKTVAAFQASGGASSTKREDGSAPVHLIAPKGKGAVVVNAGLRVPVPSFAGAGLRGVVEKADAVGLRVQAVGSGLAREQVPAAGTMVPAGTEVVVRFTR